MSSVRFAPSEFMQSETVQPPTRPPRWVSVPLMLDSPRATSAAQPVTVGIPFPQGALKNLDGLQLLDAQSLPVGLQTLPLARWPDGSIKWLLVDFISRQAGPGISSWRIVQSAGAGARYAPGELRLVESPQAIVLDTGTASFPLSRSTLPLLSRVCFSGAETLEPESARILLTDAKGRLRVPRVEKISVEARGPVRATLRCDGAFSGRPRIRFVARLCFFAATGLVRLRLTIHNPNRARHRGGLWDLGDPGSFLFRDLSLVLRLNGRDPKRLSWTPELGLPVESRQAGSLEIYQDSSGGENWQSPNHVNSRGKVPCSFRGYRVRAGTVEYYGLRAQPLVSLHDDNGTLSAALPEFWQQFPKAIEVDGNQLRIRLFPEQFGDLFELQGGEQKTHTIWLSFTEPGEQAQPLDWVHEPLRARATPEWYARSGSFFHFVPASPDPEDRLEKLLAEVTSGENSFFARREVIDEYGWRNYGEVYADHEAAYYEGPPPVISHYNNQYDVIYGAILQYLRSGHAAWFDIFDPLARHVIDIDIYHTTQDKAAYNGGLFWHTDHYKTTATCTHRTYSRANCRRGDRSYGGGPGSTNNYTTGLLHYFYLTGDPFAAEAVRSLADWVIHMDDGKKNILGLIDDGPTGLASQTGSTEYHGPGRGCGNSVNALLDAWLLTGRRSYLDKAERLIRRSINPADDLSRDHLLNGEDFFSYTVFLSVLARYLRLKAEAGQLDHAYAYARASLLHYARWMAAKERPYLDRPEELRYPTETWAAHEMRKANVMRLAAAWADEPLRTCLLKRGRALADRAWSDLLRFPSRTAARAIALLMVEGSRDSYFRTCPHEILRDFPDQDYNFGCAERFVSQKLRVLNQLKTVSGFARALVCLSDMRRWRSLRRDRGA